MIMIRIIIIIIIIIIIVIIIITLLSPECSALQDEFELFVGVRI